MNDSLRPDILCAIKEAEGFHPEVAGMQDMLSRQPLTSFFPLEIYLLVSLLKHERRQRWVGYIVESRLGGEGTDLARLGAFGRPEAVEQRGPVPGEPDWKYYFHGRGCCLTHRDGTSIDVDFADDGSTREIDPWFYQGYLTSAAQLDWCEKRLLGPAGLLSRWCVALPALRGARLIQKEHRLWLTGEGRSLAEAFEPLLDAIEAASVAKRIFLLIRLGDYINADAENNTGAVSLEMLGKRAAQQLVIRLNHLRLELQRAGGRRESQDILAEFAILGGRTALPELKASLLKRPVDGLNHTALSALRLLGGNDVECLFRDAFQELAPKSLKSWFMPWKSQQAPTREMPWNSLMTGLIEEILLRIPAKGRNSELASAICEMLKCESLGISDDDAGLLLYLLDRKAGLLKLASALQSEIPSPRQGAAAILAMIGTDESVEMLTSASHGPAEQGGHEAACALSLLDHPRAREAAQYWLRRNDGYEDLDEPHLVTVNGRLFPTWNIKDIMKSHLRESLAYELESKTNHFRPLMEKWLPES